MAVATISHAAGIPSTGDVALDAALPLPERYDVPTRTVQRLRDARAGGGRVIAVGTSVVRAREGSAHAHDGQLVATTGETDLRIGPAFSPRVVDGLLTGIHEPTASHFELLQAFAPRALLEQASLQAESRTYSCHEFGDSNPIQPDAASRTRRSCRARLWLRERAEVPMADKKTLEPEPVKREDAARVPNEEVGRTREFRERERLRGDNGGGPREDGLPNVPHGEADKDTESK